MEVHLGSWVFIRRAVRISAFISSAARSCLGISLSQVFGHPQVVLPVRSRNRPEPSASARPLPTGYPLMGFIRRIDKDMRGLNLVAAPHCRIADPSASLRGRRLVHP